MYANDEPKFASDIIRSWLPILGRSEATLAKAGLNQLKIIAVSDRHLIVHDI